MKLTRSEISEIAIPQTTQLFTFYIQSVCR